jgi:outer membrane autotransporter protein
MGLVLLALGVLGACDQAEAQTSSDFSQFAQTPNQESIANAIDNGTGNQSFNALLSDLAALPPQDIPGGLAQLGSGIAAVFPGVTQEDRRALLASFIDRLGPSCLEKGNRFGADPLALAPTVWSRGFYREADISQTRGATVGIESHPDRRTCAGLGFNYANTSLALDTLPQSGEVDAYSLGGYARRDWTLLFVDGAAAATYADLDSTRHIIFAGQTARSESKATGAGAVVGIGAVLKAGAFVFEPRIGFEYDHNNQDSYSERGTAAALRVGGDDRDALRSNLGARAHAIWNFASGAAIMPEVSVAWAHDLLDPAIVSRQRFLGAQNAAFVIEGEEPPEDYFLLGAGLSFHPNASDEIFIRYDGAWAKDDVHGDAISAGGKIHW